MPKGKRGKFDIVRAKRKEKRKLQITENNAAKRRKTMHEHFDTTEVEDQPQYIEDDQGEPAAYEDTSAERSDETEDFFYGLLSPEEQTYYSNVNAKIVANDFESNEDRYDFIEAVYRESEGKELKLASSQSCSRHFERIIALSTSTQLRAFFKKLLGHFSQLVQHRFGSHVCETLLLESAKYVSKDRLKEKEGNDDPPDLGSMILQMVAELTPNVGFMLTDRFASHTVRVLLLVLSGEPLNDNSNKSLVASKKKEHTAHFMPQGEDTSLSRAVPKSFKSAMTAFIDTAVSSLDATYLRALATHPTGSPVLQLLLRLELLNSDKGRRLNDSSLFHRLVNLESVEQDEEESKFILGLTYDPTGSHLVEVLVTHSPGKVFKKLYKGVWKDRLASMAKNEVASYVAIRILERLGKDDLANARDMLLPELSTLLSRKRTAVLKILFERSLVRELDLKPVAKGLRQLSTPEMNVLSRMLGLQEILAEETDTGDHEPQVQSHGASLAQALLRSPDTRKLIEDDLLRLEDAHFVSVAQSPAGSRLIQAALTSPTVSVVFKKQLINKCGQQVLTLATHTIGSYIVDALWSATDGLHFMRERIARELAANMEQVKDSFCGRMVWKTWSLDFYLHRPQRWNTLAKGQGPDAASSGKAKTSFQLAQERYAEQQERKPHDSAQTSTVLANA